MALKTLCFCLMLLHIQTFSLATSEVVPESSPSKPSTEEATQQVVNQPDNVVEQLSDPTNSLDESSTIAMNSELSGDTVNGTANVTGALIENNSSLANATDEAKNKTKVECTPRFLNENEIPTVQMGNISMILKSLSHVNNNVTTGECVVVLFYSSQCVFSARMGPHYNALPRVFPQIAFYAIDVTEHTNLVIRFGLVYVPNVMLFHNTKAVARFNETTLNLEQFVKFIHKFTGLEHNGTLNVTSADMNGPVPSTLTKRIDYLLILAWAFTLWCLWVGFTKSAMYRHIVEFLENAWQEAEAQHEHVD